MRKLLKYELTNALRSRWVIVYPAVLIAIGEILLRTSGDPHKALLGTFTAFEALIPLIALLHASVYWYSADRFTELSLTLPISRNRVLVARLIALGLIHLGSLALGIVVPFAYSADLWAMLFCWTLVSFLAVVFLLLGTIAALRCADRMRGIGLVLLVWVYFVFLHDALLVVALVIGQNYPIESFALWGAAVNPVGLVRTVFLVHMDAALLMGQTSAMMRRALTGWSAVAAGGTLAVVWIALPALFARRTLNRADF